MSRASAFLVAICAASNPTSEESDTLDIRSCSKEMVLEYFQSQVLITLVVTVVTIVHEYSIHDLVLPKSWLHPIPHDYDHIAASALASIRLICIQRPYTLVSSSLEYLASQAALERLLGDSCLVTNFSALEFPH